jgi:hypothetical protein
MLPRAHVTRDGIRSAILFSSLGEICWSNVAQTDEAGQSAAWLCAGQVDCNIEKHSHQATAFLHPPLAHATVRHDL